jgi:hypothetical protein
VDFEVHKQEIKKGERAEGKQCHAKTMMSIKAYEAQRYRT